MTNKRKRSTIESTSGAILSDQHKVLIERWDLKVDEQLCIKLLSERGTAEEVHNVLQLWRKINANNMLYSLGTRRHAKTVESQFPERISMPERLLNILEKEGAIIYPLRLADIDLLNSIVDEIIPADKLSNDTKDEILHCGYVTISHVWADGKMDTKAPLCKNALVDLEATHVWMDKLCVNQEDEEEKSKEIPRLKDYYKVAPLCLLAVSASSKSIMDMDNSITQLWNFHKIIEEQDSSRSKLSRGMVSAYKEKMDMLIGQLAKNGVLHHQWFTRIWTLPEMSVTQDLIVSNGDQYAYLTPLIELIRRYGHARSRDMFVEEGIVECFDALRMTGGYARFTLSEAMESSVGRTAGLDEDKIYALTGMVSEIKDLPVKYGIGIQKTLSESCKLAYKKEDVTWMLNTSITKKGLPAYGTRFLCPLANDKLWLNHDHVKIVETGITIKGSKHSIESWTHIHDLHEMNVVHRGGRLSHDVVMWANLLVHVSSDIKDLIRFAAWIGTASCTSFGLILVVVFCMSKPPSDLHVIIPGRINQGICTVLIVRKVEKEVKGEKGEDKKVDEICKVHIGRAVIIGSGISRPMSTILVA